MITTQHNTTQLRPISLFGELSNIAAKCSGYGGEGVYIARSLIAEVKKEHFELKIARAKTLLIVFHKKKFQSTQTLLLILLK